MLYPAELQARRLSYDTPARRTAWTQIDLPQPIDASRRQAFIARLRHAYRTKREGHGRHTTKVRLS